VSVRLSQVGVVPKWLNVESCKPRCAIAQGRRQFFDVRHLYDIPMGSPPTEAPNAGGVGKNSFDRSQSLWLRRLTAENVCLSAAVVCVHDGALAE